MYYLGMNKLLLILTILIATAAHAKGPDVIDSQLNEMGEGYEVLCIANMAFLSRVHPKKDVGGYTQIFTSPKTKGGLITGGLSSNNHPMTCKEYQKTMKD